MSIDNYDKTQIGGLNESLVCTELDFVTLKIEDSRQ